MAPITVSLLDYGAGNVRSVRNAILATGHKIRDITSPDEILSSEVIIFPGVGSYGNAMTILKDKGYMNPLKEYLKSGDRPYLGICLGMQTLFEDSEENESGIPGLGVVPGTVLKFDDTTAAVPHIGWNGRVTHQESPVFENGDETSQVYFVHSYYAPITEENEEWVLTSTTYGGQRFISSVQKGCVVATQFHPEKSGGAGLAIMKRFLESAASGSLSNTTRLQPSPLKATVETQLIKRIVVALDVRSNDEGDLVVTKGDQYDVRESHTSEKKVRNLGKPVSLAGRYYKEGADEIAFLNITSFRSGVIEDMPMLAVLEESSKSIFVPLTVGGGIRSYTDPETGKVYSALEVASRYFRAGADKVSIGSDAVYAAEEYLSSGTKSGTTSIEQISKVYGVQAVVVSIDPKRVYLSSPSLCPPEHTCVHLPPQMAGPSGETHCWYQCTVKGGRETRNVCAVSLARASEALGAGEIMLNCIDCDGTNQGFDTALNKAVKQAVTIPVIASSGAGTAQHFVEVFQEANVEAALAAGMFHRKEVEIQHVKQFLQQNGFPARSIDITT